MAWHDWSPYVPVAERRRRAIRKMESLRKKGKNIQPVSIGGRKIAKTFWGEAWCDHLESFSDYENRLPRGRTYVRNGSVCHLALSRGDIEAMVSGSDIYNVRVNIKTLPAKKWRAVKKRCSGQIGSLLELLRGDLSGNVMEVVTDRRDGLFPLPGEMSFRCSCPDWATMCKHVAAVLYGVGARLDQQPELLFQLRGVDHRELIDVDTELAVSTKSSRRGGSKRIASDDLSDVFGIELSVSDPEPSTASEPTTTRKTRKTRAAKKASTKKKAAAKKKATKKNGPASKKTVKKKPATKRKTATTGKTAAKKAKAAKKTAAIKKKSPTKKTKKKSTTTKKTGRASRRGAKTSE